MRPDRIVLAIALMLSAVTLGVAPVWAHGDKPHGEEPVAEASEAPNGAASADDSGTSEAEMEHDEASPARPITFFSAVKNAHPASVHFTIAFLLFAAALEVLGALKLVRDTDRAVQLAIYGAAIGAVVAVTLGWVHTGWWLGGESAMQWHRWTGTALVPFTILLAWIAARSSTPGHHRTLLRVGLAVGALAVLAQGYSGGEIAHGADHLS